MKVKIEVTVDIDPEAWVSVYWVEGGTPAIRKDVKQYCEHTLHEQLRQVGVLREP